MMCVNCMNATAYPSSFVWEGVSDFWFCCWRVDSDYANRLSCRDESAFIFGKAFVQVLSCFPLLGAVAHTHSLKVFLLAAKLKGMSSRQFALLQNFQFIC